MIDLTPPGAQMHTCECVDDRTKRRCLLTLQDGTYYGDCIPAEDRADPDVRPSARAGVSLPAVELEQVTTSVALARWLVSIDDDAEARRRVTLADIVARAREVVDVPPAAPVAADEREALDLLDEMNAEDRIAYDDYVRLHDAVSCATTPACTPASPATVKRAARAIFKLRYPTYTYLGGASDDWATQYARAALHAAHEGGVKR